MSAFTIRTIRAFCKRFRKTPGCWVWTGLRHEGGYGEFKGGGHRFAHRFSYELHKGPIPTGLLVCHKCDNPPCVNPSHLFVGTQKDNMQDMVAKGRHRRTGMSGSSNPQAVLSKFAVQAIRADYATGRFRQRDLARKYGISRTQVSRIVRGEHWS